MLVVLLLWCKQFYCSVESSSLEQKKKWIKCLHDLGTKIKQKNCTDVAVMLFGKQCLNVWRQNWRLDLRSKSAACHKSSIHKKKKLIARHAYWMVASMQKQTWLEEPFSKDVTWCHLSFCWQIYAGSVIWLHSSFFTHQVQHLTHGVRLKFNSNPQNVLLLSNVIM